MAAGGPADKVTIYDFIFTRCAGSCPLMSHQLSKFSKELAGVKGLRFVSISVDPGYDTPAVLREYKTHYTNDPRWSLLTGDRQAIIDLSVKDFHLAAADPPKGTPSQVLHSSKFVLVDRKGQIRGYYDFDAADQMLKLVKDARALASAS